MSPSENRPPHEVTTPDITTLDKAATGETTGWSQADRRMFMVTFYGGLAANIGVVLVVGAAIAVDRFISSKSSPLWFHLAALSVIGVISLVVPLTVWSIVPGLKLWWITLVNFTAFVLLCLIGYAVGIGK